MNVAIVEYGMGNIRSLLNALEETNAQGEVVQDPDKILDFDKVILPGVGAFGKAMQELKASGMDAALDEYVASGRDLLGICLGMQLVCKSSDENGLHEGLGWVDAEVRAFPPSHKLKVPHMGWNAIHFSHDSPLFLGLDDGLDVYFVHSYRIKVNDPSNELAYTEYGDKFTSMLQAGNVYGMQFHPEKSQMVGLRLLHNFCHNL